MSKFTTQQLDYLTGDRHLGRLATINERGVPHVVPLGWSYNAQLDTVDIGGRRTTQHAQWREVRARFLLIGDRP